MVVSKLVVFRLNKAKLKVTWLHVFRALSTGSMFSCAWHRLQAFLRFALVTSLPELATRYVFFPRSVEI